MATAKAVRVLFDAQEYQRLEVLAKSQGASVAALVHKAVEQQYLQPSVEERRVAVRGLLSDRSDLTWEEAKKILETDVGRQLESADSQSTTPSKSVLEAGFGSVKPLHRPEDFRKMRHELENDMADEIAREDP